LNRQFGFAQTKHANNNHFAVVAETVVQTVEVGLASDKPLGVNAAILEVIK
jgi:hypothetical protein